MLGFPLYYTIGRVLAGFTAWLLTVALLREIVPKPIIGAHRKSARLVEASVQGIYAVASLAAFASSLIIYAFLADDFSIQYVHHTSDSAMPFFYKVTAFWGGLDGSMLFWVLLLSVFSAMAVRANRRRHEEMIPHVVWILAVINLFFVGILIFVKEPVALTFLLLGFSVLVFRSYSVSRQRRRLNRPIRRPRPCRRPWALHALR